MPLRMDSGNVGRDITGRWGGWGGVNTTATAHTTAAVPALPGTSLHVFVHDKRAAVGEDSERDEAPQRRVQSTANSPAEFL